MSNRLEQHHWISTFVGVLDSAFRLTEEEQFAVTSIVKQLLDTLRIPSRGVPAIVPLSLAQEAYNGLYSLQLESRRSSGVAPDARYATPNDCVAGIEAWRAGLVDRVLTAYPDLAVEERLLLNKNVTDLLAAIGVPNRAAFGIPPSVVAAHGHLDRL